MGSLIKQDKSYSYTKDDFYTAGILNAINVAKSIDGLTALERDAVDRLIKVAETSLRESNG